MASHTEKEYTVSDRRIRFDDSETPEPSPLPPEAGSSSKGEGTGEGGEGKVEGRTTAQTASSQPPSEQFLALLEMLAVPALMYLGEAGGAGSQGGQQPGRPAQINLPAAQQFIDILTVLDAKTRGNLSAAEQAILTDLLYTLRMKYVEARKRSVPPR